MAEVFAKMSAGLDRNRKIRRAGRNGRDVFLYVLRKVADRNTSGWIPADDLQDEEWLAEDLMCSLDEVRDGLVKAFATGLLLHVEDKVAVAGWDEEWAVRKPLSNSERQARHRERKKGVTESNEDRYLVTGNVTSRPVVTHGIEHHVTPHQSIPPNAGVTSNVTRNEVTRVSERVSEGGGGVTKVTDVVTSVTPTKSHPEPPLSIRIWEEHRRRHDELKALLNANLPCLRPAGHAAGWRDLRDRIASFGGDEAEAEKACRHVLDVRETEARKRRDLVYFGDKVWRDDQFTHALSVTPPSKAKIQSAADVEEERFTPDYSWLPKEIFE